jgi:TadE-like protein
LFATMMFAIVEFGLLLNGYISLSTTAREAARWAATGLTVQQVYDNLINGPRPPGVPADTQLVTVEYEFNGDVWECHTRDSPHPPPAIWSCSRTSGNQSPPTPNTLPNTLSPSGNVPIGARVTVTVVADRYEVITPLIRPFFGCNDGTVPHCYTPIKSSTTMYFEGARQ